MNINKRIAHEEFVRNMTGSFIWETFNTIGITLCSIILGNLVVTFYPQLHVNFIRRCLLSMALILVGFILPLTLFANYSLEFIGFVIIALTFIIIIKSGGLLTVKHVNDYDCILNYQGVPNRALFISEVRGTLMILTSVCILAVDFNIFPRRFSKTETYGSSIMDLGTSCFIVCTGTLFGVSKKGSKINWIYTLKSITPLIVIGGLRTLSVKSIEYQEHVTEYGVHWNFFISLAVIKLASFPINKLCPLPYWCLAVCITSLHQLGLYLGLENYVVEEGDRTRSLIYANREGVVSLGGYLGIFYWGAHLGELVAVFMEENNSTKKKTILQCYNYLNSLVINFTLLIAACLTVCHLSLPVSRRLANLAYITWSVAFWTTSMLVLMIGDALIKKIGVTCRLKGASRLKYHPSFALMLVNEYAMTYFLVSNLLTGAVNLLVDTISIDDQTAVLLLIGYCVTALGITFFIALLSRRSVYL